MRVVRVMRSLLNIVSSENTICKCDQNVCATTAWTVRLKDQMITLAKYFFMVRNALNVNSLAQYEMGLVLYGFGFSRY